MSYGRESEFQLDVEEKKLYWTGHCTDWKRLCTKGYIQEVLNFPIEKTLKERIQRLETFETFDQSGDLTHPNSPETKTFRDT